MEHNIPYDKFLVFFVWIPLQHTHKETLILQYLNPNFCTLILKIHVRKINKQFTK